MRPRSLIIGFITLAVVFLALDAVWLTLMTPRLYLKALGPLLAAEPRLLPALAFYVIYFSGVLAFCIAPAVAQRSARAGLIRGAGFGLVAYATYDLTNQATLKVWPTQITALDLLWGAFVTAVGACAATALAIHWSGASRHHDA